MNATLSEQAVLLRDLHHGARPLVLPNAWDVASARLVEKAGFPVIATSSGAIASSLGYEDTNSMPVEEAFGAVARIAQNVSIPVTADMEGGYHLSPVEFVTRLLDAGAVGCNIEDTDHDAGSGLLPVEQHADWLRAVKDAAAERGIDIVINARLDAMRQTGDEAALFDEALRRAGRYLEAGADCVFPIKMAAEAQIADFVARVNGPVNILGAAAPPLPRLAQLGVARVSFAGTLMSKTYASMTAALADIARASSASV
ncbi:MAG: Carboxyvinyl-carboxyphosphonate phosphorylmutase [uncultured Thermomicrobiales bacterium]|uniref:Carboxyvinyl-carboxyphosphonate phosphorylmutase n=1 Tax=uncultured Thermomicrobiales bacterium TaxID=1645740 RepID=A0A6J4UB80_9BACT|nr:MAG: Carboxyvinyl-carboxyphosphonate phosphorylmutase [uncultured Thermomicrobiales bacterium]